MDRNAISLALLKGDLPAGRDERGFEEVIKS